MLVSVKLRGEEIDVEFDRVVDEPEVNYFAVEWDFLAGDYERLKPTDDELKAIEEQLCERERQRHSEDYGEVDSNWRP